MKARIAVLVLLVSSALGAAAQLQMPTPTPSQSAICDSARLSVAQCIALVFEFNSPGGQTLKKLSDPSSLAVPPGSQILPDSQLSGDINALLNAVARDALVKHFEEQALNAAETRLKELASDEAKKLLAQRISTTASTNQAGSSSNSAGSTNLVAKPKTTDFISLASETGAFTETNNGSTITLQANADGLLKFFTNHSLFERWESDTATRLQPLNLSVTFNVAQSGTSSVQSSGPANSSTPASITSILIPSNNVSLSAFTASYAVYQKFNPQDKKFSDAWEKARQEKADELTKAGSTVATSVDKFFADVLGSGPTPPGLKPVLVEWHTKGKEIEDRGDFSDPQFAAFVMAYAKCADAYNKFLTSKSTYVEDVLALKVAVDAFEKLTNEVFSQARGTALATLSYTYATPVQKPATHQFSMVIADLFRGGKPQLANANCETVAKDRCRSFLSGAQLTGNFNASVYATLPPGAVYGRLRDLQMSGEFSKPFGGTLKEPRGTLSAAGYGQYQYDPTVLNITAGNLAPGTDIPLPANAQLLFGKSGWLGVVQGKLVINLKQGLNIPVAIKWSNKTDLIQANDVRGQIGLSYDLSALSKLLTSGKQP
jgi:hypothetical protein